MAPLTLVINLGSSSLKAALLEPGGVVCWHQGRSLAPGEELHSVLDDWLARFKLQRADREDLVQESLTTVLQHLGSFRKGHPT